MVAIGAGAGDLDNFSFAHICLFPVSGKWPNIDGNTV